MLAKCANDRKNSQEALNVKVAVNLDEAGKAVGDGEQDTPDEAEPRSVGHEVATEGQVGAGHALSAHATVPVDPRETHPEEVDERRDGCEVQEPAEDDSCSAVHSYTVTGQHESALASNDRRTHVGQTANGEHKEKRGKGNTALGGVAEDFGSLALAGEGMKRANSDEDEGVAAGRRGSNDNGAVYRGK